MAAQAVRILTKKKLNFKNKSLMDRLWKLTNPGNSWMKDIITTQSAQEGSGFNALAFAYVRSRLVGWAFVERSYTRGNDACGVFVHPDFRRQGIGKKLIRALARRSTGSTMRAMPWDTRSRAFYNNFDYSSAPLSFFGGGRITVKE